jgi:hypothetical protein
MRVLIVFLAFVTTRPAGEKAHFDGTWEPQPELLEFWRPFRDSWWKPSLGISSTIERRCKEFARSHSPEATIPEMISDLKAYPSEVRWFVYLHVMLHWPQKKVLHVLKPFLHSSDPDIHHIAAEFYADVESLE